MLKAVKLGWPSSSKKIIVEDFIVDPNHDDLSLTPILAATVTLFKS